MDNLALNVSGTDLALAERIQTLLEEKRGQGTAISAAIVRDGEVIAAAAAGSRDGDQTHGAAVKDLYNVGSVSKVYCAAAVLKLCEMGKLDLDTPVYHYLSRFTMADERYKKITLRMCLNHSAGFPGTMWNCSFADRPQDNEKFYDDFFCYLSKAMLNAEPGAYTVYCNDGFDLAAAAVAAVSGMCYSEFLRQYITGPLGCPSTCTGDRYEDENAHIRFRGYVQHVNTLGAGGIATNLIDCAKFGWEFAEAGKVLSPKSVAQTMEPQKLARDLRDTDTVNYGLGWDNVNLSGVGIDLGEGALFKGGATGAFNSALIVSPKLRISAAISLTGDVFASAAKTLCEVLALLPDVPTAEQKVRSEAKPIPAAMQENCAGVYYHSMGRYEVSFHDDRMTLRLWTGACWLDMAKDLPFDGEVFYDSNQVTFHFLENEDFVFLMSTLHPEMDTPIAVKQDVKSPLNEAWRARNGKRYLVQKAKVGDTFVGELAASLTVETEEETGIIYAAMRGPAGAYVAIPFLSDGDDGTKSFLYEAPFVSRNVSPPIVWREDGKEYLYTGGITFVEESALPTLSEGRISTGEGDTCLVYRVEEGNTFSLAATNARILVLDKMMYVVYDTLWGLPIQPVGEGYVILLSDQAAVLDVSV